MAELEEWDDTSDVIVWLIEQCEEYHLSCPELELRDLPTLSYRHNFDFLEEQKATLTGYTQEHSKVSFDFRAEYIEIEDNSLGYKVTVHKAGDTVKVFDKTYIIHGENRKEFELIALVF